MKSPPSQKHNGLCFCSPPKNALGDRRISLLASSDEGRCPLNPHHLLKKVDENFNFLTNFATECVKVIACSKAIHLAWVFYIEFLG